MESHCCHAPGPCALPWAPCAFWSAPKQWWQLKEPGLIKASPGGGGAPPQEVSFSKPGSPGRNGDRATASQRVRPGAAAAAGTRSSASARHWGQTLFSSSVELGLVRQRRPYPLPAPPRHRYPLGRLLKGDDAPFPCGGSALGSPRGIPDSLASASLPFSGAWCLNPKLCACPLRSPLGALG